MGDRNLDRRKWKGNRGKRGSIGGKGLKGEEAWRRLVKGGKGVKQGSVIKG